MDSQQKCETERNEIDFERDARLKYELRYHQPDYHDIDECIFENVTFTQDKFVQ